MTTIWWCTVRHRHNRHSLTIDCRLIVIIRIDRLLYWLTTDAPTMTPVPVRLQLPMYMMTITICTYPPTYPPLDHMMMYDCISTDIHCDMLLWPDMMIRLIDCDNNASVCSMMTDVTMTYRYDTTTGHDDMSWRLRWWPMNGHDNADDNRLWLITMTGDDCD